MLPLMAAGIVEGFAPAQIPAAPKPSPAGESTSPAPRVLMAAPPRIGFIEVYGNEKLEKQRVIRLAGVAPGDALSRSRRETEEDLEKAPEVIEAHVEGHCCLGEEIVLYIGIVESGTKPFALHSPPAEDLALPTKIDLVYQRLARALEAAHERGATGETYDKGYPLSEDAEARRAQETLPLIVDPYVEDLGEILRRSSDETVRAAAAYILAYAQNRQEAEAHLQHALRDFDPDVRQNALRSLEFIRRAYAAMPPDSEGIRKTVSPTWLIEMLQSVSLEDRLGAAGMLVKLVPHDGGSGLLQMEERALPALLQMAQWQVSEHAAAAYTLLGRIAGIPEDEIEKSFREKRRDVVLQAIRERAKAKKRFLVF
ncbi:MAG: HEAT repeat domain-containing protein [Bryobacterales bacterium]|nr:HEAT repeat domain-containing protein [Bryobacterales bacterium]